MTLSAEREVEVVTPDVTPPRPAGLEGITARPGWLSQHLGTAVIGAVLGYLLGHWLGNVVASGYPVVANSGENTVAVAGGLLLGVVGWLLGIGALNYPLAKLVGTPAPPEYESTSWSRYLRYTPDHKVVGLQYTIGVLVFFFTGGLLAMAIRTELLSPTSHIFGPGTYIAIVSQHGTMMMMMATSVVVGPLGNWLIPLMIGARRTAFPASRPSASGSSPPATWSSSRPCSTGAFPPGGPATPPCRPRPAWACSPTSSASP